MVPAASRAAVPASPPPSPGSPAPAPPAPVSQSSPAAAALSRKLIPNHSLARRHPPPHLLGSGLAALVPSCRRLVLLLADGLGVLDGLGQQQGRDEVGERQHRRHAQAQPQPRQLGLQALVPQKALAQRADALDRSRVLLRAELVDRQRLEHQDGRGAGQCGTVAAGLSCLGR